MEPLGRLLQSAGQSDQPAFIAAAIVEQTNQILYQQLSISADFATTASYKDGVVTIEAKHGAVAARLKAAEDEIRAALRGALQARFPNQQLPISRIVVRTI